MRKGVHYFVQYARKFNAFVLQVLATIRAEFTSTFKVAVNAGYHR